MAYDGPVRADAAERLPVWRRDQCEPHDAPRVHTLPDPRHLQRRCLPEMYVYYGIQYSSLSSSHVKTFFNVLLGLLPLFELAN